MKFSTVITLMATTSVTAFTTPSAFNRNTHVLQAGLLDDVESTIQRAAEYQPGAAQTPFAERFRHLKGTEVKTVGEAFAEFTEILGQPLNALYKNMMTDIVGTTHLIVVNARFTRDPIWSLGMISALDLLLKNYPEEGASVRITSALFKSVGLNEEDVRAEAAALKSWASGKTKEDIANALKGMGDGPIPAIAQAAKDDEYWMYSRFFGIGLVALMDEAGVEMTADDVYPVMEEYMGSLGKAHFTACSDSDTYFKIKGKLDMMETMMKEIEIREKKRMAQRLEEKAEAAIRKAERDVEMAKEIEAEKVES